MWPFSTCRPSTKSTRDARQLGTPRSMTTPSSPTRSSASATAPPIRSSSFAAIVATWRRWSTSVDLASAATPARAHDELDRLLDAAPQLHRVDAVVEHPHPLADQRLRQQRRGRRAVAGELRGLVGDLAHELRAHVLELVGELDLARDRDAVVGDRRRARQPLQHDVAALRAERHLDGVGELSTPGLQPPARVVVEVDDLAHGGSSRCQAASATRMPRPCRRPPSRSAIASLTASSG